MTKTFSALTAALAIAASLAATSVPVAADRLSTDIDATISGTDLGSGRISSGDMESGRVSGLDLGSSR